jgi:hypothetical protein
MEPSSIEHIEIRTRGSDLVSVECQHRLCDILLALLSSSINKISFHLICAHPEICDDRGLLLQFLNCR